MALYEEEQTRLEPDLRGRFRFGVTYDEIKNFHPKIVRLFSFTNASEREVFVNATIVDLFRNWPSVSNLPYKNGASTNLTQLLMQFKLTFSPNESDILPSTYNTTNKTSIMQDSLENY
jgi:hypothetical protein